MRITELDALIQQVTQPGLSWGVAELGESDGLRGDEAKAIARAVPKRQAEFAAGRLAARRALGMPDAVILPGSDRVPYWPAGYVGSISHSGTLAVAVVARDGACAGIGVDLEQNTPMPHDLLSIILRPEEQAAVPFDIDVHKHAVRAFSAKEAIYKSVFPRSRIFFDFQGLDLHVPGSIGRIVINNETMQLPVTWASRDYPYAQSVSDAWILSLCILADAPY